MSDGTIRAVQILMDRGITKIDRVDVTRTETTDLLRTLRDGKPMTEVTYLIAYRTHPERDFGRIEITQAVWDGTE